MARRILTCYFSQSVKSCELVPLSSGGKCDCRTYADVPHLVSELSQNQFKPIEGSVSAALDALKREGINKVGLLVFAYNEAGNAFWEKQGFTARTDIIYRNKALAELVRIDT